MYIHEKLMLCALDLLDEHQLKTVDVVGALCHAGFTLSEFTDNGIKKVHDELKEKAGAQRMANSKLTEDEGHE